MTYSRLSPETQEMLSAYIDGELDDAQRQELERRLHTEADLAQALAELRGLKGAFSALPHARAPRNFTLSPEQAGLKPHRRKPIWRWAAWSAAGALAVLVLMAIAAGGFALFGGRTAASAPPMIAAAPQSEQAKGEQPSTRAAKPKPLGAKSAARAPETMNQRPTPTPTATATMPSSTPTPAASSRPYWGSAVLLAALAIAAVLAAWLILKRRR